MAAAPSTDAKVPKQRFVTVNFCCSLSQKDICRKTALCQGDVELLHPLPEVYQGNQPQHEQLSKERLKN